MADEANPAPAPNRRAPGKWTPKRPDANRPPTKSRKRRQLFWATALLLAVLGAAVGIATYLRGMTAPALLSVGLREYKSLPPNPWAEQDSLLLQERFGERQAAAGDAFQSRELLEKLLGNLKVRRGRPVVVQFCAWARVQRDEVYLLPADAPPQHDASWLPLADLIQAVELCPDDHKLLVLDVMRPLADVRLGVLTDDVADRVQAALEARTPRVPVLCACLRGQHSHVSEELGASALAHYLEQGLRGAADGFGPRGRRDRRVTVQELAEFVRVRVDRWAWFNRGARQEPRLWGVGDFPLVQLDAEPAEPAKAQPLTKYPAWLKEAWARRDQFLADDVTFRLAPRPFRLLELALLEAEKDWRSGRAEDRVKKGLAEKTDPLVDYLRKVREGSVPRPASLAESSDAKVEAAVLAHRTGLDLLLNKAPEPPDPAVKADENAKAQLEEFKKDREKYVEKLKPLPFEAGVAVIVDSAVRPSNLTPGRLQALLGLLGDVRRNAPDERPLVETVFLERLRELATRVKDYEWRWPADAVREALAVTDNAERLLVELGRSPELLFPWNQALWKAAEDHRRRGEKTLFTGTEVDWREAQGALALADQGYRRIRTRLGVLRQMLRERDRAYLVLPGWAPFLSALGRPDSLEDTWRGGVRAAAALAASLEAQDPDTLAGEPPALQQWLSHAAEWERILDARVKDLLRRADRGGPRDYLELHALLESPRPPAELREKLWTTANKLGQRLHQSVVLLDDADDRGEPQSASLGQDSSAKQELDRAQRRVAIALDLLRLTPALAAEGEPPVAKADKVPVRESLNDKARQAFKSGDRESLQELGKDLHREWAVRLPGLFRQYIGNDPARADLAKADRLSRVIPGREEKDFQAGDVQLAYRNPRLALRRNHLEQFAVLLRARYQEESQLLEAQQQKSAADFFRRAAGEVGR